MSKFPEVFPPHLFLGQCLLVLLGLRHEKPTKTSFAPPSPFFLPITGTTILCNFRWCESSRVLRVVWSHRVNDDGKPVLWSLGYNEAMETSALWPGAACRGAWARHSARAGRCTISGSVGCGGTAGLRALRLGRSAPGTSISLASEETPSLSAGSRVCTFRLVSSLFLGPMQGDFLLPPPLYFRGPPISSKDSFAVLKNISLNRGIAFWVKWLNFKVLFSSRCDAVRLLPLFAYKPCSRIELTPFRGWHGMLFLISSYCLQGLAYPGLGFFTVIAFINRPLMAA